MKAIGILSFTIIYEHFKPIKAKIHDLTPTFLLQMFDMRLVFEDFSKTVEVMQCQWLTITPTRKR